MRAEQKELFRRAVLSVLDRNRSRFGLGGSSISFRLPEFGFTKADTGNDEKQFAEAVAEALDYLAGKNLCEEVVKTISRENRAWRITADGIAFLDQ